MSSPVAARSRQRRSVTRPTEGHATSALAAAVLGFFVITLDAVVVNVALPSIRADLGGGVTGPQWVVDGYTLMFAALLLTAGSLTDRIGARRAFGAGLVVFVLASAACGEAPTLAALVAARFVQGTASAVMMPSSMALIRQAFPELVARGRAVAVWAMGGAVASSSGPVLGGVLDLVDWRWIFFINLPVGAVALALLARVPRSVRSLSTLGTGVVFLPMMLIGAALIPFSARIAERLGHKALIVTGLSVMTVGLVVLGVLPETTPLWGLSVLMILVGLGGPLVSPPATAVLLDAVPEQRTGTTSGVFNTSRQIGGALAVVAVTAFASLRLRTSRTTMKETS